MAMTAVPMAIHWLQRGGFRTWPGSASAVVSPASKPRGETLPKTRTAQAMVSMLTIKAAE